MKIDKLIEKLTELRNAVDANVEVELVVDDQCGGYVSTNNFWPVINKGNGKTSIYLTDEMCYFSEEIYAECYGK